MADKRPLKDRLGGFDSDADLLTEPKPPKEDRTRLTVVLGRELRLTFSARDGAEWKRRVQDGEDFWAAATKIAALAGVQHD